MSIQERECRKIMGKFYKGEITAEEIISRSADLEEPRLFSQNAVTADDNESNKHSLEREDSIVITVRAIFSFDRCYSMKGLVRNYVTRKFKRHISWMRIISAGPSSDKRWLIIFKAVCESEKAIDVLSYVQGVFYSESAETVVGSIGRELDEITNASPEDLVRSSGISRKELAGTKA